MNSKSIKILALKYLKAKDFIIENGYFDEIDYYQSLQFTDITEKQFIKETAWVILSSGMRENVIRKKFSYISDAFLYWSVQNVCLNIDTCRKNALAIFNNDKKIDAILSIIVLTSDIGFDLIMHQIHEEGISYLKTLPYIGEITAYHIAKNLGLNYSKPDRHLCRIADVCGYNSPQIMCQEIAQIVGDEEKVIDLVLWRYATINKNYLDYFEETSVYA